MSEIEHVGGHSNAQMDCTMPSILSAERPGPLNLLLLVPLKGMQTVRCQS